ncbi:MAG: AAA family ATPase [Candidatus Bruticola sp.]
MAAIGTQSLSQLVKVNIAQKTEFDLYHAINGSDEAFLGGKFKPLSPQLEALKAAARSAVKGGIVLLTGAYGVGKTSLLALLGKLLSLNASSEEFSSALSILNDVAAVKTFSELRSTYRPWLTVVPKVAKDGADFSASMKSALRSSLLDKKLSFALDQNLSLEELYEKAVSFVRQSAGLEGILILLDEADALVEKVLKNDKSVNDLEEFCSFCRRDASSILFITCVNTEINRFSLEEEERAVSVFSKVQSVSIIGGIGEWESFVGSSIIDHAKGELWEALVDYKDLRSVTEGLIQSGLYKGSSEKWITETVMHGTYPLHPAVAFSLPRVALVMAGAGKTAFNFFCDAAPGGFLYFLRNFAIVQPNGRLHLYTLDSLFTYFEKAFSADPANAEYIKGLNKSVMIAGDIPQARRILRLTLLIQLIAHDRFKSTEENILWSMHLGEKETKVASHSLQLLREKKALEFNEKTGEYSLPIERRKVTLDEAVSRMRNRVRSQLDVCSVIKNGLSFSKIEAEDFNREYYTDRFARVNIALASELDDPAKYMSEFVSGLEQIRPYRGDLCFFIAVPETEEELQHLKKLAEDGAFKHERLIFALLGEAVSISKEALDVLAVERVCAVEVPFCDPASSEHEKAAALMEESRRLLEASVARVSNTENLILYHNGEVYTDLDADSVFQLVNKIIASLVGQPPMLSNGDLLSLHDGGMARRFRQNLISYILGCRGPIALRYNNRGLLNIIQSAFVETGLLEADGVGGSWHYFHLSKGEPTSQVAQGYAFLCSEILGLPGSVRSTEVSKVVKTLTGAPYGFTPALIELLLALAFWQFHDYLVLHKNLIKARLEHSNEALEEVSLNAKVLFDLVSNPSDWEMTFTDCTPEQLPYLQGITKLSPVNAEGEKSMWVIAGKSLLAFYNGLSVSSRSAGASGHETAEKLRALLEKTGNETYPRYRPFLEVAIPEVLGFGSDFNWSDGADKLLNTLREVLHILEDIPHHRSLSLCSALRSIFASHEGGDESSTWSLCASTWYNSNASLFEGNSKWAEELRALSEIAECTDADEALNMLLCSLGYLPIEEWKTYSGNEIIERFRAMRQDIEWGSYRSSCVLPSETAAAYGTIKSVLCSAPLQNLESFLGAELEWASWPEKVVSELRKTDDIADYGDLSEWSYTGSVSPVIQAARLQDLKQDKDAEEKIDAFSLEDDEEDLTENYELEPTEDKASDDRSSVSEPVDRLVVESVIPEDQKVEETSSSAATEEAAAVTDTKVENRTEEETSVVAEVETRAEGTAKNDTEVSDKVQGDASSSDSWADKFDLDESTLQWL